MAVYLQAAQTRSLPHLKPKDKSRAKILCLWFDAMATKEEHATLGAKLDGGACKLVVQHLHKLVKVRLREAYTEAKEPWPRSLLVNNDNKQLGHLKAGSMDTHRRDLKNAGVEVDVTTLRAWRKEHEVPPSTEPSPSKRPRTGVFAFFGGS